MRIATPTACHRKYLGKVYPLSQCLNRTVSRSGLCFHASPRIGQTSSKQTTDELSRTPMPPCLSSLFSCPTTQPLAHYSHARGGRDAGREGGIIAQGCTGENDKKRNPHRSASHLSCVEHPPNPNACFLVPQQRCCCSLPAGLRHSYWPTGLYKPTGRRGEKAKQSMQASLGSACCGGRTANVHEEG